ncbi:MAG: hypothetical protein WDO73_03990 [Ignavibacteriota bacterium]
MGLGILNGAADVRSATALGAILGLGLLTKAYFLAAVPAVAALLLYRYRKARLAALATPIATLVIAGWWYVRNELTTGTFAGLAESVTLQGRGSGLLTAAIPRIPWVHAVDVVLVSHLYFCGWSGLKVRAWMYTSYSRLPSQRRSA